ncbi:COM1 regulatory protein [Metarhizium album ARSEF 1941]|uniref:COM1 regulatory protein n=1 Tax=Metarhizium album (strain ARSEF 1941) TaxID=1081103 RepID=A0A0B2WL60_METAS|nr:COM1 regulatory protein [Metarhizium album ARSEF 1941]KHN96776.1 COM1 regulatory protein [Metarhizium album ARSEF 1941]
MTSLKVPDGGWMLAGSADQESTQLPQAFVVNLSDDVVEQMIQSARIGDDLELELGKRPMLHYGPNTHRIPAPEEEVPFDLYLTKPFESTRRAERLPHAGSVFIKPKPLRVSGKQGVPSTKEVVAGKKPLSSKASAASALDFDIEALQNGLAAHDAARDRARVVEKLPTGKGATKTKNKVKPLANYASPPKSITTSPALNATRSPNLTPQVSASQQVMERKREQRFTLVHELAVTDRMTDYLKNKWTGKEEDFRPTLEKMADLSTDSKKWTMKKACWKELDVWKYDYGSQDDRQTAIDNAVRQYDKQRLSSSEVEWQRLLPKEERGKGKCLSRLQANLAKGPAQAATKAKADNSGPKDDTDGVENDKTKYGGEGMSRSNSASLRAKSNKLSAQEAQTKRLLSNSKSTAAAPKTSPSKARAAARVEKRVLSAAIIENSDSSGDEAPIVKPKPAPTQGGKAKDTVIVNTRPSAPAREPVRRPPVKRAREESDSSSSSGTPLSKRIKPKQPLPAPGPRAVAAKGSRQLQARAAPSSFRSKNTNNTSPTKSSPLASSPPTNASDLGEEPPVSKKRKADKEEKPILAKRRAVQSVPSDVLNKAHKFKTYYQQYESLHYEITALDNPPHEKLASLLDLRDRLQIMKREIYKQYSSERE